MPRLHKFKEMDERGSTQILEPGPKLRCYATVALPRGLSMYMHDQKEDIIKKRQNKITFFYQHICTESNRLGIFQVINSSMTIGKVLNLVLHRAQSQQCRSYNNITQLSRSPRLLGFD